MSAWVWIVVAFLGWLSVVGFVLLLVRGGAEADRIEWRRVRVEQARTVRPWVQR
jgi:hypothetical protein